MRVALDVVEPARAVPPVVVHHATLDEATTSWLGSLCHCWGAGIVAAMLVEVVNGLFGPVQLLDSVATTNLVELCTVAGCP